MRSLKNRIKKAVRLCLLLCLLPAAAMTAACSAADTGAKKTEEKTLENMEKTGSMELLYADQFSVDYYEGGYSLIRVEDGFSYLLVPPGAEIPATEEDLTVICQPVEHIYLAASSAMDLFRELEGLDFITLTGTKQSDWTIPEVTERMEEGSLAYGGKYNAPDYEAILAKECDLAIESTMIYHNPEVREQLEEAGLPVFVERSSYESHPLGRTEWICLYGLLCGKEQEAEQFMEDCQERYEKILGKGEKTDGPKVAFFYISSAGYANVRKPGDYITHMIETAGGSYAFSNLKGEENNLSTVNLEMETFYEQAVDADILIYNSTVGAELNSKEELLQLSPLLADFKAVKENRLWCTNQNMYQETTGAVAMMEDLASVIAGEENELTYLHRLK